VIALYRFRTVPEHKATGEFAALYHDIKQTLRVSGVDLLFSAWASYDGFLPAFWEAFRPNARSRAFEDAADRLRASGVLAADPMGRLGALNRVHLGESQAYQARAALMLYHYANPKLLLVAAAASQALQGEPFPRSPVNNGGTLPRGVPARMAPMELVDERPADPALRDLFKDILRTLELPMISSDYRSLALWPLYLAEAWSQLKPFIRSPEYGAATRSMLRQARELARTLPYPVALPLRALKEDGVDIPSIMETTETFHQILPPQILNIALLSLDWESPRRLALSPFPLRVPAPEEAEV
jgi:hypothetical protein